MFQSSPLYFLYFNLGISKYFILSVDDNLLEDYHFSCFETNLIWWRPYSVWKLLVASFHWLIYNNTGDSFSYLVTKWLCARRLCAFVLTLSARQECMTLCSQVRFLQHCILAVVVTYWYEHHCTGAGEVSSNHAGSRSFIFLWFIQNQSQVMIMVRFRVRASVSSVPAPSNIHTWTRSADEWAMQVQCQIENWQLSVRLMTVLELT